MSTFALAAVVVLCAPGIGAADSWRDTTALVQLRQVEQALDFYRRDTKEFPASLGALVEEPPGVSGWAGPYVREVALIDPWGNPFSYAYPSPREAAQYDLYSVGMNSQDDEGVHDDITAWAGVPRAFYPRPFPWELLLLAASTLGLLAGLGAILWLGTRALLARLPNKALQQTSAERVLK